MAAWEPLELDSDPDEAEHRGDPGELVDATDLLAELLHRPAWHRDAACRGQLDRFFPGQGDDLRPARQLCAGCPVREPCLDAGMDELQGIWGGASGRERKRRRRTSTDVDTAA